VREDDDIPQRQNGRQLAVGSRGRWGGIFGY